MTYKSWKKIKNIIFSNSIWIFALVIATIFTSHFDPILIFTNFLIAALFILVSVLVTNRVLFSIFLCLFVTLAMHIATNMKAEYLSRLVELSDILIVISLFKNGVGDLLSTYLTKSGIFLILVVLLAFIIFYSSSKSFFISKNKLTYYITRILMLVMAFFIVRGYILSIAIARNYPHQHILGIKVARIEKCESKDINDIEKVKCRSMGSFLNLSNIAFDYRISKKKEWRQADTNNLIIRPETSVSSGYIKYKMEKEPLPKTDAQKDQERPNIVVALNESIFDPSYLDYEFAEKLKFKFFNDEHIKSSGVLRVHTFGGGTCISEYAALTGVVHDVFGGAVGYPFVNMAERTNHNLIAELKKLGYYTVIVYSTSKKFVDANKAFSHFGVDKFVDIWEYNYTPVDWRDIPEKLLGFIVENEIQKAPKDKPVFVFVSTMRNHGPHKKDVEDKIGCASSLNESVCSQLNDYINRLTKTDEEWNGFIEKIMKSGKNTIFFNFGDHQPSFDGEIAKLKFKYPDNVTSDIYRTFYNIRANFDIPNYNYKILDISYFPSMILEMAGGSGNNFYKASSYMRERCNGLFKECKKLHPKLFESYKSLMVEQLNID